MRPWPEADPERWAIEVGHAQSLMSDVGVGADDKKRWYIEGTYTLYSRHGYVYDRFRLRVLYPAEYPRDGVLPEVYLLSHQDQWQAGRDSHIEPSWRMCLFVVGEAGIHSFDKQSLPKVFAAVHTFLLRERLYQRALVERITKGHEPSWPGPQRAHGIDGLVEAVSSKGVPGWNAPCPCGSGSKFKKCHGRRIHAEIRRGK